MKKEKMARATVYVSQDVLDVLKEDGCSITKVAREALDQEAAEVWSKREIPPAKLLEILKETISLKEEEVRKLRRQLDKSERSERGLSPSEARVEFAESFESWTKIYGHSRVRGKKKTSEADLWYFPIKACQKFCDEHSEELALCKWTPETLEGRPFTSTVEWLRKATSRGQWRIDEDEVDF